ncbi:uncharacterized protein BcabD6B2_11710 [Babesia caballi]|uniref:Membrane protein, putative n=1 Tax=Babesia caballi TaxID=5871 RepID=A0AAV4LRN5_BABCB|nr:membrane protein, putative [Babesia caballi]
MEDSGSGAARQGDSSEVDAPLRMRRRTLCEAQPASEARDTPSEDNAVITNRQAQRNRQLASLDRALLSVPYIIGEFRLKEVDAIIEKELLLVTSYLTKRLTLLETRDAAAEKLNRALQRLHHVKAALRSVEEDLAPSLSQLAKRLTVFDNEFAFQMSQIQTDFRLDKYRKRVAWLVSEYLARRGYMRTAKPFAEREGLQVLCDSHLYEMCHAVYNELRARRIDTVLAWAEANEALLEANDSMLLDELRVQQVILRLQEDDITGATSLIRSFGRTVIERCRNARTLLSAVVMLKPRCKEANQHAQRETDTPNREGDNISTSFKPGGVTEHGDASPSSDSTERYHAETDDPTFPRLTCLYCANGVGEICEICQRYRELTSAHRWVQLAQEFERCIETIYGMGPFPQLERMMHTGFCAIKSTTCGDQRNSTCPACLPVWREYVDKVPAALKLNSALLCPVTGELMNYDNPPYASPGGYLPSDSSGDFFYQFSEVLCFGFAAYIAYLCMYKYKFTYEADIDTMPASYILIPSLIVAIVMHPKLNRNLIGDICWAFALYVETFGVLPQLIMFQAMDRAVTSTVHFTAAQAASKIFGFIFWCSTYRELNSGGTVLTPYVGHWVIFTQFIQVLIVADFFFHYMKCLTRGIPVELIMAEDV